VNDSPSNVGTLIVIAAPSGAGKTTLVRALMQRNPELRFSISYTTRTPRSNEKTGEDYYFVDTATFKTMIAANDFLEHAEVFDNHYGTSRTQIESLLKAGHSVILEIDWQGAQQVRKQMPQCRSVFILPPSLAELKRRLTGRGTDTAAVIERRFRDALTDMAHWDDFDHVIINDDLPTAVTELNVMALNKAASAASRTDDAALRHMVAGILGTAS
jgi:guanylate kinase